MNTLNKANKFLLIITLCLVGFIVAIGTVVLLYCEECLSPDFLKPKSSIVNATSINKCDYDFDRCISVVITSYDAGIAPPVGTQKVAFLEQLVSEPIIQNAIQASNIKHDSMNPDIRQQIFDLREKTWTNTIIPTPFMKSIIQNDVSDFLRTNHIIRTAEEGDIVFGEHILTDIFGANVAVSVKTDNYLQSNDDWWQLAKNKPEGTPFARQCEFDSSAEMFSEDLVVGIFDINNQLIGILNSATPCDVTVHAQNEPVVIEPTYPEDYSDIGRIKIKYLRELMQDPIIQNALAESNLQFLEFSESDIANLKDSAEESNWPPPGEGTPTELQLSIIQNDAADFLRQNLNVTTDSGQLLFPEMIITNNKGVNVASTDRTYRYVQNMDAWWQAVDEYEEIVRQCGFDRSIKKNSEDILLKIFNEQGEFVGILNAATPCNVLEDKAGLFFGDSN